MENNNAKIIKTRTRNKKTSKTKDSSIACICSDDMYVHQEENKRRIYELMEAHGVYSEGMREQVWICAKIMSKVDDIEKYMKEDGYHMLQKIQSSQGERYDVHPLERMYMRYLTMAQTAIKALGLNRDSKPVRDVQNDDALSNLISSIGEEE